MQKKWTFILGGVGLIVGLIHPDNIDFGVATHLAIAFAIPWAIFFALIGLAVDHFIRLDTHVKCPDCRELVKKDARKCKHCGCILVPQ